MPYWEREERGRLLYSGGNVGNAGPAVIVEQEMNLINSTI